LNLCHVTDFVQEHREIFVVVVEGFFGFSLTNLKIVAETAGGVQ